MEGSGRHKVEVLKLTAVVAARVELARPDWDGVLLVMAVVTSVVALVAAVAAFVPTSVAVAVTVSSMVVVVVSSLRGRRCAVVSAGVLLASGNADAFVAVPLHVVAAVGDALAPPVKVARLAHALVLALVPLRVVRALRVAVVVVLAVAVARWLAHALAILVSDLVLLALWNALASPELGAVLALWNAVPSALGGFVAVLKIVNQESECDVNLRSGH